MKEMLQTENGETCDFPFTYFGTEYKECTTVEEDKPRCFTDQSSGDWGFCRESCSSTNQPSGNPQVSPGQEGSTNQPSGNLQVSPREPGSDEEYCQKLGNDHTMCQYQVKLDKF